MSKNSLTLVDYVMSGYPAIVCRTSEEQRAIKECYDVALETNSEFICWSETRGIFKPQDCEINDNEDVVLPYSNKEKTQVLIDGLNYNKNKAVIFCLLDFHHFLKCPTCIRTAKDVFQLAKNRYVTYIFVSNEFEPPADLKHEMVVFDMNLPGQKELENIINAAIDANEGCKRPSNSIIKQAANALSGLNSSEAENAVAVSMCKDNELNLDVIYDVKKQTISQDNLLEYYNSNESMDDVGGMQEFKDYIAERSFAAFSEEAQEYGLPYPKGVLLFGIPGCGKSLAAKALANMWKVPLIKFDLSKFFGSLVGQTETNTRRALKIAESMAPCVIWLDEVDKAISGAANSGRNDSGVTSRMFGTILTWLQEKQAPVYAIATANNINLPPEFLRKGRFDEIFFVDLPNDDERKEIIKIQLKKHKRDYKDFDVDKLVEKSKDYNGAEIEEAIVSAMFKAWNDGKRPYTTEDIEWAMDKIIPSAKGIMQETVSSLRRWSEEHGIRNANSNTNSSSNNNSTSGKQINAGRIKRANSGFKSEDKHNS